VALIVAAVLRRGGEVCLIEQQGPWDAAPGWMLPGGRVDGDETLLDALAREVREETGLTVAGTLVVAFLVAIAGPEGPYTAITFACDWQGELAPADPDGFVRRAEWVPIESALARLAEVAWYDALPLQRYLAGEAAPGTTYGVPAAR
jgi:8-oxo-dGTP diphosphatase